jgi:hypothetical protein
MELVATDKEMAKTESVSSLRRFGRKAYQSFWQVNPGAGCTVIFYILEIAGMIDGL